MSPPLRNVVGAALALLLAQRSDAAAEPLTRVAHDVKHDLSPPLSFLVPKAAGERALLRLGRLPRAAAGSSGAFAGTALDPALQVGPIGLSTNR